MRRHRDGFCRRVDRLITEFSPAPRNQNRTACFQYRQDQYYRIVNLIRDRSTILNQQAWQYGNVDSLQQVIRAISRVAVRYRSRVRDLETWRPASAGPGTQIRSMIRHLFLRYPAPGFLLNGWFSNDRFTRRDIRFSQLIGQGYSPRRGNPGFWFTKSLLREFMSAPDDLSINQALRWAQVRAEGGSTKLARVLIRSIPRVSEDHLHEAFWTDSIHFFVQCEKDPDSGHIGSSEIESIIEFCNLIRFYSPSRLLGFRLRDTVPLHVDFSLRGKSPKWIRRFMINWREELAAEIESRRVEVPRNLWKASPIQPFETRDERGTWTITELLARHEMVAEGHFMRHCVASDHYVDDCRNRKITIWSLKRKDKRRCRRMATIEVETDSSAIVTALAKCNETPTRESQSIIEAWARREKLAFSPEELYD